LKSIDSVKNANISLVDSNLCRILLKTNISILFLF